jgi:uncharacterized protein
MMEQIINQEYNSDFVTNIFDNVYELGKYYQKEKNYDEMKKYYLMAIENGSIEAMRHLRLSFKCTNNEMKKYYLMAIENGDISAMFNLGLYYQHIEKNYDEMKKYYFNIIKIEDDKEYDDKEYIKKLKKKADNKLQEYYKYIY